MELLMTPTLTQALAPLSILFLLYHLGKAYFFQEQSDLWTSQPTIGLEKTWFPWLRATLLSVTRTKVWAFDAYSKYSKRNIPYIMPCIDRGAMVIIPPQQIKKVYDLPESILDVHDIQNETIQTRWTVADQEVANNNFQINVIRNQITRNLKHLTPMIATELEYGFERWWGTGTEWKEINVWESCLQLIAGAANGAFCGAPLCRDDEFLKCLRDHAMAIFAGAMVINSSPKPIKPIFGTLVSWLCRFLCARALKRCLPTVRERLDNTAGLKADPSYDWIPPKDGLQWIIDECYATGNPIQLDPNRVSQRLLLVNDISLHSTSYTVQNVILDLFSTDPELGFVDAMREECAQVLEEAGGSWTFDAVKKLKLVDSAIRESMRLSPFGTIALPRRVIAPNGISLENVDVRVPYGSILALPVEPIHYDEAIYSNPYQFNAFRFSQPATRSLVDYLASEKPQENESQNANKKSKSTVTLDDSFLGFGFGKNACPGRFFALNEMKIFMAHMLLNYEIEYMPARPEIQNVVWLKMPANTRKMVKCAPNPPAGQF
ncbi:hypothetical protein FQN57_003658 [Myotisia sp. PD_48]|nr:hypothetical protein FQN57_003658 [Myotisia sp. PD_48]